MSFGGGGNWMGGYMSQLLGLSAQQAAQRENSWREQRDWMEQRQFVDTLERQKEAEALARQRAELNRNIDPEQARALREQHPGLSAGLQDEEFQEMAGLRAQMEALNRQALGDRDPNLVGPPRPEMAGPPAPSSAQGDAQKKLTRLKFLEEKEKANLQRPMKVQQAVDMKNFGLGYPRTSQRRPLEDEIALIRERGEVRKGVENNKQRHIHGRFDISTKQRRGEFDQMMGYRYAALRDRFNMVRYAKSSDERVAAMKALQTEAIQTEAAMARLNTSINMLAKDPAAKDQLQHLLQKRQELMQYLGPARETLAQYGLSTEDTESFYEYEGGSAPSLNVETEVADDEESAKRIVRDAEARGEKVKVRVPPKKKANGSSVKSAIDEAKSLF